MSSSIKLPHTCPNCGKIASTAQELEKEFGYRNIKINANSFPKEVRNQSWCKSCR